MNDPRLHRELSELVGRCVEGDLSVSQQRRLADLLASHPAFVDEYAELLSVYAAIRCDALTRTALSPASPRSGLGQPAGVLAPSGASRIGARYAMAAALLIAGVAVAAYLAIAGRSPAPDDAKAPAAPVASVIESTGDLFVDGEPAVTGEHYRPGTYSIDSGEAELLLTNLVSVTLNGRTSLAVHSDRSATLTRGSARFDCPPAAKGYTVHLSGGSRVVDLGTAFELTIVETGGAKLRVIEGEVEWRPADPGAKAVVVSRDQYARLIDGRVERITGGAALLEYVSDGLVGYYPFEGDARNHAGDAADAATVSNVTFAEGRAGRAAELAGHTGSYIDLPIDTTPEAMPKLTWGAWVKPAALSGRNRQVFSADTNGYLRSLALDVRTGVSGAPADSGRHRAAAFAGLTHGVVSSAAPAIEPGQWRFVAAVYDADRGLVTVYCDDPATGALVATRAQGVAIAGGRPIVRIGGHPLVFEDESFEGLIDEAFIFADTLSAEQLEAIRRGQNQARNPADDAPVQPNQPPSTREGTVDHP